MIDLNVGKDVMVFDHQLWNKNRGDSETDSFMRKATILKIYSEDDLNPPLTGYTSPQFKAAETLIDVRFYHDGRISKAHFARVVEDCK